MTTVITTHIIIHIIPCSSFLEHSSYSLKIESFKIIAHSSWSSAIFLHFLTPSVFRSSSTQSSHLNLDLPGFLLPPGFPKKHEFIPYWPVSLEIVVTIYNENSDFNKWPPTNTQCNVISFTLSCVISYYMRALRGGGVKIERWAKYLDLRCVT
jgi:hypothetical protein